MSDKPKRLTAIKAIRRYCVDTCAAGDEEEVRNCPCGLAAGGVKPCPLFRFRMGKNTNIGEEAREKARQRAKDGNQQNPPLEGKIRVEKTQDDESYPKEKKMDSRSSKRGLRPH